MCNLRFTVAFCIAAAGVAGLAAQAAEPPPAVEPPLAAEPPPPAAEPPVVDLAAWPPPQIDLLRDDPFGRLVRYGRALMADTPRQIGPVAADPAKRYSGNSLTCQNCHLKAGTRPYAMPLIGVWGQYPQYRGREGTVGTLEERLNGCMERSMNGRALPLDSVEMKAFLAYMRWLSTGIPIGARLTGAGTMRITEPDRAADLGNGGRVYARICALCHGADGRGRRVEGYQFPPVAGPDSFNNGSGMTRILTAAGFVRSNMPFGATVDAPILSNDDAYDVAAYINSLDRQARPDLEKDYPVRTQKPVDVPYGPWADGFPAAQHKYGPFGPIRAKLKELAAERQAP
jgi:thiosulfate dehydrogenase